MPIWRSISADRQSGIVRKRYDSQRNIRGKIWHSQIKSKQIIFVDLFLICKARIYIFTNFCVTCINVERFSRCNSNRWFMTFSYRFSDIFYSVLAFNSRAINPCDPSLQNCSSSIIIRALRNHYIQSSIIPKLANDAETTDHPDVR